MYRVNVDPAQACTLEGTQTICTFVVTSLLRDADPNQSLVDEAFEWQVRAYDLDGNQGDYSLPAGFSVLEERPEQVSPLDTMITFTTTPSFTWTHITIDPAADYRFTLQGPVSLTDESVFNTSDGHTITCTAGECTYRGD